MWNREVRMIVLCLVLSGFARAQGGIAVNGPAISDFTLVDYRGNPQSLETLGAGPVTVVAFLGTECPLAKHYGQRLSELAEQYRNRGVSFVGIDANVQDSLKEIAAYARKHNVSFPILIDRDQHVADLFGAVRTPEVFVLDANRIVRYHGRVDDQFAINVQRPVPQRQDLTLAIDELLDGQAVTVSQTPVSGCLIGRKRQTEPHGDITFTAHVAPILFQRCAECHRAGEIAPFPLLTYDDVMGWEDMIAEVIQERRMPPWNANPEFGHFANDARLSAKERDTLLTWIANGCPQGDPSLMPPAPEFTPGWRIPKPDVVITMRDKPYDVPATGVVDYQYFAVDPGFTEDMYMVAAQARPGNSEVVHHIIAYLQSPGEKKKGLGNLLIGYAPGAVPLTFPEGAAVLIPKGSKLLFELHYTPNGVAQSDRSEIGLKFVDKAQVKRLAGGSEVIEHDLNIPPQTSDHVVTAEKKVPADVLLISLTPHMHLRGKSFRYEAFYPDGTSEVLLDVPDYDFNWQLRYELAEPKLLPRGTRIKGTAVFDNSSDNPNNPDPDKKVHWGQQSWDEMMIGFMTYVTP